MTTNNRQSIATALTVILGILVAGCQYEPKKDTSSFVSAMLMNEDIIIFSYQNTVYRPAAGMSAYPDGGTPKYIKDRNIIGYHNMKTEKTKVLLNENNRKWACDTINLLKSEHPSFLQIAEK